MEVWKDIPKYKGMYQASSEGRVRSVTRFVIEKGRWGQKRIKYQGKLLNPWKRGEYLALDICGKTYLLHTVILETFVGKRPKGMQCRHLDGDPTNNKLENLKWGTAKENSDDKVIHGTAENCIHKGESHGMSKLTEEQVKEIIILRNKCVTLEEIAKKFEITKTQASRICTGKSWAHLTQASIFKRKGNTRYTDEQRADIISKAKSGIKTSIIAKEYGCSRSYISKMLKKHLLTEN